MKVAIVHDYLNQYGGAERVVEAIAELYPEAPIFTSIYDPKKVRNRFVDRDVHTSFMQRLPGVTSHHQVYLPFYPLAFDSLDLSGYDLVISSSSAWGKAAVTGPETLHICYCHSPMRFAWQSTEYAQRERLGRASRALLPVILHFIRRWDIKSSTRPDYYIANSRTVAERIRKYWHRDSTIINPPVEVNNIPYVSGRHREDFYLTVGRLVPYKRMDVTVRAFKELDLPLKVVGSGRDLEALKRLAGPKTEFLTNLSDKEVRELFCRCRAFIQTGSEDFGITPIEAMGGGAPVIAINQDGPAETIIDGKTGLFFDKQTPEALAEAVRLFEKMRFQFNSDFIRKHAQSFDREIFQRRFGDFVSSKWEDFQLKKQNGQTESLNIISRREITTRRLERKAANKFVS